MARQDDSKPRFSPDQLNQLLKDYLLCASDPLMNSAILEIARAARFSNPVAIVFPRSSVVDVRPALDALCIQHTVHWSDGKTDSSFQSTPPIDHSIPGLRIVMIPKTCDRVDDFELLVPFVFDCLLRSPSKPQQVSLPSVHGLFLLLLQHFIAKGPIHSIFENVSRYITDNYDNPGDRMRGLDKHSILALGGYPTIRSEHPVSAMYMGLELRPAKLRELNPPTRRIQYSDIGLAMHNMSKLWHLDQHDLDMDKKVRRCLIMRLEKMPEERIAHELGIDGEGEYARWLQENHIDLIADSDELHPSTVYNRWQKARKQLFEGTLGCESELREIAQPTNSSGDVEKNSGTQGQIRFDEKYRTIFLNNSSHEATDTQFIVIRYLYQNPASDHSWQEILSGTNLEGKNFHDVFRKGKKGPFLREKLIVQGKSRFRYRANPSYCLAERAASDRR